MGLVTLEEIKERLSVDFFTKDTEIQELINSAETNRIRRTKQC